ncbi:hypothetical protein AAMO2058_000805000 [Amorphochlora amoebiformis]
MFVFLDNSTLNTGILAHMGTKSPINAGVWISRPSIRSFHAWLGALQSGFSEKTGWNHTGPIQHIWPESLQNGEI